MTKNYLSLIRKLNDFRSKYYIFQLVKGILISLFFLIILFTLFSFIEYFIYLPSSIRKIIFYGFIIFGALISIHFIIVPSLQLFKIIKPIDIKSSSVIIQNHFKPIKDKLINVIELVDTDEPQYSADLLAASIDQKISELSVFDFKKAVQFKNLKFLFIYFLMSITGALLIFFINSSVLTAAPQRIIHYNQYFEKPAPFSFQLLNDNLKAVKGDAFVVKTQCIGESVPSTIYINIDGNNYLMKSSGGGIFEFEIASVINTINFHFTDLKYRSKDYLLSLLPKPGINNFQVNVDPPQYTGLPVLELKNGGDIQIALGSSVKWSFQGIDIDSLYILFDDTISVAAQRSGREFSLEKRLFKSSNYHVYIKNDLTEKELALSYRIDVIPDLYPEIKVIQVHDSTRMTRYFFKGTIGDDYGFTDLKFHFNISNNDSSITLPFLRNVIDQDFYYSFDFSEISLPGSTVSYYFSVSDNDMINGYKSTTSNSFVFTMPDKQEILAGENEQFDNIEKMLQESATIASQIRQDLNNLSIKNMDTNTTDWERSEMVNEILNKQSSLEKLYDQIKDSNEKLSNYKNSFNEQSEKIKEKQKQIEDLLEEVFTDELKKLLEEFQKLAQQFDNKKLNQLSEKMDFSYEDLQKQLDRNLEMLRRMQVEQKLQSVIDDIIKVAENQGDLSEKITNKDALNDIIEKHGEDKQSLSDIENSLKDALGSNMKLEKPLNFDEFEDEFKDIHDSMDDTESDLNRNNRRRSSNGFKENQSKLENLAFSMQQMLDSNTEKQNLENLENLKRILSNLLTLSFEQEDILVSLGETSTADPNFSELNLRQFKIREQSIIVRDSLYALAMRTPQISSMINNELTAIEMNFEKVKGELEEGRVASARVNQQYVMTAINNLALLLDEALSRLEEEIAGAQSGDQNCEKPGSGKPSMSLMQQQSESLKQQLQQMIDQMKSGGDREMSPQFGQTLMQQEMMQQMLREVMNNGSVGSEAKKALQQIDDLIEQNRKQLMNKQINAEMINRQNLITSRLLEAERSELEREFEDERESRSAEDFYSKPIEFFEPDRRDIGNLEYIQRGSLKMHNFYNSKYKQYIENIDKVVDE